MLLAPPFQCIPAILKLWTDTHQDVLCPQELLEDFTSGGFNLDLMDDDGPAFTSDPVFSSPQVSSPNSSHHSFDDALTPDSMDIAT